MTPSVITGSILVNYDVAILQPEVLDQQIRRLGFPSGIRAQPEGGSLERLVEALFRKLFENAIEALAAAAIEAAI